MRFLAEPRGEWSAPDPRWLGSVLLLACAGTAACTFQPWRCTGWMAALVEAAWRSPTGFSCLMSCLLLALLTVIETRSRHSRDAVRPACLFVAGITAAIVAIDIGNGPGGVRGIAASWTGWFWFAVAGMTTVVVACVRRLPRRGLASP